ncbi:MAG: hypothetical protein E7812_16625 [Phenylobacterium sp.]|nr:MAG: hypothetical protein E7812_16625 [Phenylobacterium sp.]
MSAPEAFSFGPGDQPAFPGSPYAPLHPLGRRAGYVAVAALFAIVASLGNAVVTVNVPSLAAAFQFTVPIDPERSGLDV